MHLYHPPLRFVCLGWLAALLTTTAAAYSQPAGRAESCNSATAVREAFYSGTWDGDLLACLNNVGSDQVPERDVMKIAIHIESAQFADAIAAANKLDADESFPKGFRVAINAHIRVLESTGWSMFSPKIRVEDFADSSESVVIRDPLSFSKPQLLLPLLYLDADYDLVQKLIDKIQILNPDEHWLFLARGRLAVLNNRPAEAISVLSLALSLYKDESIAARYWLARAYELERQHDQALREYTAFIDKEKWPCHGLISRGVLFGLLGERMKSIQDSSAAINTCIIKEGVLQARHNRATEYRENGQLDQAITDYNYVIQHAGFARRFIAQMDLAGGYFNTGRHADACNLYLDLANATRENFQLRWVSRFLSLLNNIATCLSVKIPLASEEVEAYFSHIIFILNNSWKDARFKIASQGLFGLLEIHENHSSFLIRDTDQYYRFVESVRHLAAGDEYPQCLDLLEVFGGRSENIKSSMARLREAGLEQVAIGVFILERFVFYRQPDMKEALADDKFSALKMEILKDDSAQWVYLGLVEKFRIRNEAEEKVH